MGDYVWHDSLRNGIQDDHEYGWGGLSVHLFSGNATTSMLTTPSGGYLFSVHPGTYSVKVDKPADVPGGYWKFTEQNQGQDSIDSDADQTGRISNIIVNVGDHRDYEDIGLYLADYGSIADLVWDDADRDGVQDPDEVGLAGIQVKLYRDGSQIQSTSTNATGEYRFDSLREGEYAVQVVIPEGKAISPADAASDTIDSDGDAEGFVTIDLEEGQHTEDVDFGLYTSYDVHGYAWSDLDWGGTQDLGELPEDQVDVELYKQEEDGDGNISYELVEQQSTALDGTYRFVDVEVGTYYVKVDDNELLVDPNQGNNDAIDSDILLTSVLPGIGAVTHASELFDVPSGNAPWGEGANPKLDIGIKHVDPIDLDVDSDNDNGFEFPDRTDEEDEIEADGEGKRVEEAYADSDNDGIPDFADGFDLYLIDGNLGEYSHAQMTPLIIEIPPDVNPDHLSVSFSYPASAPNLVSLDQDGHYIPASGGLRLWTKPGEAPRHGNTITAGGDYVHSDTYLASELLDLAGMLPEDPEEEPREILLYVEGIESREEAYTIRTELLYKENDDPLSEDEVNVTVAGKHFVFGKQDAVTADDTTVELIYGYLGDDRNAFDGDEVHFELIHPNGAIFPNSMTIVDGTAGLEITLPTNQAGDVYQLIWKLHGRVIGEDSVQILPGVAAQGIWHGWRNGIAISLPLTEYNPAEPNKDDVYELEVEFKDQYGNLVVDGTPVTWFDFEVLPESVFDATALRYTSGGRSSVTFSGDEIPGHLRFLVRANSFETEQFLTGKPLTVSLSFEDYFLYVDTWFDNHETTTVTAHVDAPNGTPIHFFDSKGLISAPDSVIQNGTASATISIEGREWDARGRTYVTASAAGYMSDGHTNFVQIRKVASSDGGGPQISSDNVLLSQGLAEHSDATTSIDRPTGDAIDITASNYTTLELTGLDPNTSYRVALYGNRDDHVYFWGGDTGSFDVPDRPNGETSYDLLVFSRGESDRVANVRAVLEEWTLFGWSEVATDNSFLNFAVGDKDVLTELEYAGTVLVDVLWGAFAGSDDIDAAFAGDLAISLMPGIGAWADVRDLAKNIWRLTPFSDRDIDVRETMLAALGLIAEPLPALDLGVDLVRALSKISKAAKFGQFFLAVEPIVTAAVTEMYEYALDCWENECWNSQDNGANGFTSAAFGGSFDDLIAALKQVGPATRAAIAMLDFANEGNNLGAAFASKLLELGEKGGNTHLAKFVTRIGDGTKAARAFNAAITDVTDDEELIRIFHGLEIFAKSLSAKDAAWFNRIHKALVEISAEDLGRVLRQFGAASRFLSSNLSSKVPNAEIADLVPKLARMGILSVEASKSVEMLLHLGEMLELAALKTRPDDLKELLFTMITRGESHDSAIRQLQGYLFQFSALPRVVDELSPGFLFEVVRGGADSTKRIDYGDATKGIEVKRGLSSSQAKAHLKEQFLEFAQEGKALFFIVPRGRIVKDKETTVKDLLLEMLEQDSDLRRARDLLIENGDEAGTTFWDELGDHIIEIDDPWKRWDGTGTSS
ncbi:MAG: SdrD B-like domain-containing protein [Planctomycetota bacterium]